LDESGSAVVAYYNPADDGESSAIAVFSRHGLNESWIYKGHYFYALSYNEQHKRYWEQKNSGEEAEPLQHPFFPLSIIFISPKSVRLTAVELEDYKKPLSEATIDIDL
jgi:hypothetical protein